MLTVMERANRLPSQKEHWWKSSRTWYDLQEEEEGTENAGAGDGPLIGSGGGDRRLSGGRDDRVGHEGGADETVARGGDGGFLDVAATPASASGASAASAKSRRMEDWKVGRLEDGEEMPRAKTPRRQGFPLRVFAPLRESPSGPERRACRQAGNSSEFHISAAANFVKVSICIGDNLSLYLSTNCLAAPNLELGLKSTFTFS